MQPEKNVVLRLARRWLPVSRGDHRQHGRAFFVRQAGRFCITPLFLVLLVMESSDIVFAVDSVPAVLGITTDAFVVFSSNVFAILGLRALYFLLAGAIDMFRHLHYGLAAVLAFVGISMIADYFFARARRPFDPYLGETVGDRGGVGDFDRGVAGVRREEDAEHVKKCSCSCPRAVS